MGFCEFQANDVVRHPMVQRVVTAYAKAEKLEEEREKARSKNGASPS